MKIHITSDEELKNVILNGLKENNWYCPCIVNSKGQEDYRCICKDMRENIQVGESCHCGLYIKDEM